MLGEIRRAMDGSAAHEVSFDEHVLQRTGLKIKSQDPNALREVMPARTPKNSRVERASSRAELSYAQRSASAIHRSVNVSARLLW